MAIFNVDCRIACVVERVYTMEDIEAETQEDAALIAAARLKASQGDLTPKHGFFQGRLDLESETEHEVYPEMLVVGKDRGTQGFVQKDSVVYDGDGKILPPHLVVTVSGGRTTYQWMTDDEFAEHSAK